ncbi:MAG TPA: hypothetical protein VK395_29150 [Gemmataceae bacterium]|nr:hypothetical protein [Gemmataceae bacterium]
MDTLTGETATVERPSWQSASFAAPPGLHSSLLRIPGSCGRRAILSDRRPTAGLSLPSSAFRRIGIAAHARKPCRHKAKRLARRSFRLLVSDNAVSFDSIHPHPVAILTAL